MSNFTIKILCLNLISVSCFINNPCSNNHHHSKLSFLQGGNVQTNINHVFPGITSAKTKSQEEEESTDESETATIKNSKNIIIPRRKMLLQTLAATTISPLVALLSDPKPSNSMGLVQFPCKAGLSNTYNVMRAGESLLEEQNLIATNPLFLTNREAALSLNGIEQVRSTCQVMLSSTGAQGMSNPSIIYFSLAAKCSDTADIIASELTISRNRILPEFTFLDRRAVGLWDMLPLNSTEAAIWALDVNEAGILGTGGRPPPHDDGTAHETLNDQVLRLRQFLSVIETSRSGENVLFIFPDGTGPALLTCLISGIPLNRVHEFEIQPGETRLDLTYENGRQLLSQLDTTSDQVKKSDYEAKINYGKEQLELLYQTEEDIKSSRDVQTPVYVAPKVVKRTTTTSTTTTKAVDSSISTTTKPVDSSISTTTKAVDSSISTTTKALDSSIRSEVSSESNVLNTILGSIGVALTTTMALWNNGEETNENTNEKELLTSLSSPPTDSLNESNNGIQLHQNMNTTTTTITTNGFSLHNDLHQLHHKNSTSTIMALNDLHKPKPDNSISTSTIMALNDLHQPQHESSTSASTIMALNDLHQPQHESSASSSTIMALNDLHQQPHMALEEDIMMALEKDKLKNKEFVAEQAMAEYMNQDDGADDWLTSIGQIMND